MIARAQALNAMADALAEHAEAIVAANRRIWSARLLRVWRQR